MEPSDFIKELNSRSSFTRAEAVENGPTTCPAFALVAARMCLTDCDKQVRRVSADVIGELGSARDGFRLLLASKDVSWDVRSSVVAALGLLRVKHAGSRIADLFLNDRHFVVRREAAWALVSTHRDAVQILREGLSNEKDSVVHAAIYESLYALGDESALTKIFELFSNKDDLTRHNVINGLGFLEIRANDLTKVVSALESLISIEENPGVRGDAISQRDNLLRQQSKVVQT